jgi:hypothetical protein
MLLLSNINLRKNNYPETDDSCKIDDIVSVVDCGAVLLLLSEVWVLRSAICCNQSVIMKQDISAASPFCNYMDQNPSYTKLKHPPLCCPDLNDHDIDGLH